MTNTEVIIVGGGPAGSTCAWKLVQAGTECLVVDAEPFPRDKPCAGWTTPDVLETLEIAPGSYPHSLTRLERIHFHLRGLRIAVPTRQLAIRRQELDDWLLRRSGVPLIHHRVREVVRNDGGFVIDGRFRCRFVVGAGGTSCPVYRGLFEEVAPRHRASLVVALEAELPCQPADRDCHLWFFDPGLSGYSWYLPKEGGFVNIGVGGMAAHAKRRGSSIHRHWEELLRRLAQRGLAVGRECKPRGYAYYLWRGDPVVHLDGAFLVGDAAGLATLDMGEGIGAAVRSGALAADAIATGAPYSLRSLPKYSIPRIVLARWAR
ncbi:MAG: NAD(P)/FAD-dependent oxidoreductase [Acidobacteriota bacterium]